MGALLLFFRELFRDTLKTILILFRIMIPVSVAVKALQELGVIPLIGEILYPVMKYAGLPGEMGLVWATGMITNLFGGVIAFLNIARDLPMSVAQVTAISMMMLVAHTFPIELTIARKTGVRLAAMFLFRFVFAYLFGMIVFWVYHLAGFGAMPASVAWRPDVVTDPGLGAWAVAELKNYAIIVLFVFILMLLIKILKKLGIIDLVSRWLNPALRFLGISNEVITISIVGLTLGVVYGGVLIISEVRENPRIGLRDVFYAMCLMGLCHSIIEDTILMMSLGASFAGVFVFRILLSILVIFVLVRITRRLPDRVMNRLFIIPDRRKTRTDLPQSTDKK